MEDNTPQCDCKNKIDPSFFSRFIGKLCEISLKDLILIPSYDKYSTRCIKGIVQGVESDFLLIKFNIKKKNYISALKLQHIVGITIEEN